MNEGKQDANQSGEIKDKEKGKRSDPYLSAPEITCKERLKHGE
jgi:hypothetical protein